MFIVENLGNKNKEEKKLFITSPTRSNILVYIYFQSLFYVNIHLFIFPYKNKVSCFRNMYTVQSSVHFFFPSKVEFVHPVALLRAPKELSPIPSLLFSLKPSLIRLSLLLPATLVKDFDLFDKSSSQFSAHIWFDLQKCLKLFPSLLWAAFPSDLLLVLLSLLTDSSPFVCP